MQYNEIRELLTIEEKNFKETTEKIEEALWFLAKLEEENHDSYQEKENLETDLKVLLEELNIDY